MYVNLKSKFSSCLYFMRCLNCLFLPWGNSRFLPRGQHKHINIFFLDNFPSVITFIRHTYNLHTPPQNFNIIKKLWEMKRGLELNNYGSAWNIEKNTFSCVRSYQIYWLAKAFKSQSPCAYNDSASMRTWTCGATVYIIYTKQT